MDNNKCLTFNNGRKVPVVGLGTWRASDAEVEIAINEALEIGYRHIDTAPVYANEKAIGRVLSKWFSSGKLKREDVFIVTKLPPIALQPELVEETLRKSLADLQLDYADVYLIHVPFGIKTSNGEFDRDDSGKIVTDPTTDHIQLWQKMEEMVEKGLTKTIGISNFNQKQIQRLLSNCKIRPANLQIEHHIYLQQRDLIDFCKKEGIIVTAYAPLGSKGISALNKNAGVERELPDLMDNSEIKKIAAVHNKTPAQILLRWIIDSGLVTIPKSTNAKRLRENFEIFDFSLSKEEMERINKLDANVRVCDFQFFKGVEKHPEFPF